MAQITAALVKQLREMTDSPMMECKKALVEAEGDLEKAVDVLRTMGIAKAVKRAGRDTNEGTIATFVSEDGKTGAILELSCETDFVGTNPKFTGFATKLAQVVAEQNPADVEALKACELDGETVDAALTEMIHVIGENMKVLRFQRGFFFRSFRSHRFRRCFRSRCGRRLCGSTAGRQNRNQHQNCQKKCQCLFHWVPPFFISLKTGICRYIRQFQWFLAFAMRMA